MLKEGPYTKSSHQPKKGEGLMCYNGSYNKKTTVRARKGYPNDKGKGGSGSNHGIGY